MSQNVNKCKQFYVPWNHLFGVLAIEVFFQFRQFSDREARSILEPHLKDMKSLEKEAQSSVFESNGFVFLIRCFSIFCHRWNIKKKNIILGWCCFPGVLSKQIQAMLGWSPLVMPCIDGLGTYASHWNFGSCDHVWCFSHVKWWIFLGLPRIFVNYRKFSLWAQVVEFVVMRQWHQAQNSQERCFRRVDRMA